MRLATLLLSIAFAFASSAQVTLVSEIKITDGALYFDGDKISGGATQILRTPNRKDGKFDYAFGPKITPHGDCIKKHGDYLFLTWYKGGKDQRQVMLTRHNLSTQSSVTIEFPHQHTGFQNKPYIGESHNTIAVGICPKDETVHLLYDMHSYSSARPADGSLKNDYFRYSVSRKNAATLPDHEFTLDKFFPKRSYLKKGENYESLTYPDFFVNLEGDLFVKMREGGSPNGKFMLAKYDGDKWSDWVDFNYINARSQPGLDYNWGLYGTFNYLNDVFHIGFAIRTSQTDKYKYNNGIFYAWSKDPVAEAKWFDVKGRTITTPLLNPYEAFISEPGDQVAAGGDNSVVISSGPSWTVTERGDIHFVANNVRGARNTRADVHTYRKAGETSFATTTDFPGGSLERIGNSIYIVGLNAGGRPYIKKAEGGTNDWQDLYEATSGKTFRHGNVLVADGKVYYYLMESGSGSAQPLYVHEYQLTP